MCFLHLNKFEVLPLLFCLQIIVVSLLRKYDYKTMRVEGCYGTSEINMRCPILFQDGIHLANSSCIPNRSLFINAIHSIFSQLNTRVFFIQCLHQALMNFLWSFFIFFLYKNRNFIMASSSALENYTIC